MWYIGKISRYNWVREVARYGRKEEVNVEVKVQVKIEVGVEVKVEG